MYLCVLLKLTGPFEEKKGKEAKGNEKERREKGNEKEKKEKKIEENKKEKQKREEKRSSVNMRQKLDPRQYQNRVPPHHNHHHRLHWRGTRTDLHDLIIDWLSGSTW